MMKGTLKASAMILAVMMFIIIPHTAEANDDLMNMVEVRTSGSDTPEAAQAMIDRLENVDDRILYETNRAGVSIILMDGPLTDLPEFSHLEGVTPRGWEASGSTWDVVPGAGGYVTAARIGYSEPGNGHSTTNLELHEYGHAVDTYAGGFTISETEEFRSIMNEEKDALFSDHEVSEYFDTPSEYFAEVFAMYYLNEDTRSELESRAPQTHEFIATLHHRLLSFGEITGNSMSITWDDVEGAASYDIYQDGEKVDEVDAGEEQYTATDLDTSTSYEFYVRAVDESGEEILTSYYRYASTMETEDGDQSENILTEDLEDQLNEAETLSDEVEETELNTAITNAEGLLESVNNDEDIAQEDVNEMTDALSSTIETVETAQEETSEEVSATSDESDESAGEVNSEMEEEESDRTGEEEVPEESSDDGTTEEGLEDDTASDTVEEEAESTNLMWQIATVVLILLAIVSAIYIWINRRK